MFDFYDSRQVEREKMAEVRSYRLRHRDTLPGSMPEQTPKFKTWVKNQEAIQVKESERENEMEVKTIERPPAETEPATKAQLWYLHILMGIDTRGWQMTKQEASQEIKIQKAHQLINRMAAQ